MSLWDILLVISVICMLWAIGMLVNATLRPSPAKPKVAEKEKKKWETYGHPKAPIPEIYKRLPSPPPGFVWEINIGECGDAWRASNEKTCPSGTLALQVGLLDLTTGTVVTSKRQCLVMENHICEYSYANQYRRYSSIKESTFDKGMIRPLVEWADKERLSRMTYETHDEYLIKDR